MIAEPMRWHGRLNTPLWLPVRAAAASYFSSCHYCLCSCLPIDGLLVASGCWPAEDHSAVIVGDEQSPLFAAIFTVPSTSVT